MKHFQRNTLSNALHKIPPAKPTSINRTASTILGLLLVLPSLASAENYYVKTKGYRVWDLDTFAFHPVTRLKYQFDELDNDT